MIYLITVLNKSKLYVQIVRVFDSLFSVVVHVHAIGKVNQWGNNTCLCPFFENPSFNHKPEIINEHYKERHCENLTFIVIWLCGLYI